MGLGKVPEAVLKRTVLSQVNKVNKDQNKAGVGNDAGLFAVRKNRCGMSSAAVSGREQGIAALSVIRACNSLRAAGTAKDIKLSVVFLLPSDYPEEALRKLTDEMLTAASEENGMVVNGHTQYINASEPTVSVTAFSEISEAAVAVKPEKGIENYIVMAGNTGISGTGMIAREHFEDLTKRYRRDFIERAADLFKKASDIKIFEILDKEGISKRHDVSEGGVFGALWELLEREKSGATIDIRKIPILQETIEVTEFFDINPYTLRGDGAVLFLTDSPENITEKLMEAGIASEVIGMLSENNDRILVNEDEERFLEPNRIDDYYKIKK